MTVLLGLAALHAPVPSSTDELQVYTEGDAVIVDGTDEAEQVLVYSTRTEWRIQVTQGDVRRTWSASREHTPDFIVRLHGGDDIFTAITEGLDYRVHRGSGNDIVVGGATTVVVDDVLVSQAASVAYDVP